MPGLVSACGVCWHQHRTAPAMDGRVCACWRYGMATPYVSGRWLVALHNSRLAPGCNRIAACSPKVDRSSGSSEIHAVCTTLALHATSQPHLVGLLCWGRATHCHNHALDAGPQRASGGQTPLQERPPRSAARCVWRGQAQAQRQHPGPRVSGAMQCGSHAEHRACTACAAVVYTIGVVDLPAGCAGAAHTVDGRLGVAGCRPAGRPDQCNVRAALAGRPVGGHSDGYGTGQGPMLVTPSGPIPHAGSTFVGGCTSWMRRHGPCS